MRLKHLPDRGPGPRVHGIEESARRSGPRVHSIDCARVGLERECTASTARGPVRGGSAQHRLRAGRSGPRLSACGACVTGSTARVPGIDAPCAGPERVDARGGGRDRTGDASQSRPLASDGHASCGCCASSRRTATRALDAVHRRIGPCRASPLARSDPPRAPTGLPSRATRSRAVALAKPRRPAKSSLEIPGPRTKVSGRCRAD